MFPLSILLADPLECYILLVSQGESGVYRVNSPAGRNLPIGFLFDPGEVENINIDSYRNVHLILLSEQRSYRKSTLKLNRQVYTGPVIFANRGHHSIEHVDFRNQYVVSNNDKIFRPWGAAHSRGPGEKIYNTERVNLPQTDTVFPHKQWYEIPNGSWYQTWNTIPAARPFKHSYAIFYDRLEEKRQHWQELIWSGNYPNGTIEKYLGKTYKRRLFRSILNGCLEPCGRTGQKTLLPITTPIVSTFWIPGTNDQIDQSIFYSGSVESASATILWNGQIQNIEPLTESHDPKSRWIVAAHKDDKNYWLYILGNDILHKWLPIASETHFDLVTAATGISPDGVKIFAWDNTNQQLFRFQRNETASPPGLLAPLQKLNLGTNIEDAKADKDGDFYYVTRRQEPKQAPRDFSATRDLVAILDDGLVPGKPFRKGRIIYSRKIFETVYRLQWGKSTPEKVGEILLGRMYMAQIVTFPADITDIFFPSGQDFYQQLRIRGGILGPWLTKVPEFPEAFYPPTSVHLGIRNEY